MTKHSKEFVNSFNLDLINVSDLLNNTTLGDSSMTNTQNSQNNSPQKPERSNSQNWECNSPQKSECNSTLTEFHDAKNDTSPDSEEKSFPNSESSSSQISEQQVSPERSNSENRLQQSPEKSESNCTLIAEQHLFHNMENDTPQQSELITPDSEEKSFQNSELSSSQSSEQQVTPNSAEPDRELYEKGLGLEPDGELSEKGVAFENTKDDNILKIASPKPINEKLNEIVIEKNFNYVGTLQELCMKKQLTQPSYGLERVDGPPHCPTFHTFCEVGPYRQVATAANKKLGKQVAAAKVLEFIKMDGDLPDHAGNESTLTNFTSTATVTDIDESVTAIANPVGWLQEWCVKNQKTPPKYGIEKTEGPPHCPTFYTFCEVEQHREIASSKSKKSAKDKVARQIIMLVK